METEQETMDKDQTPDGPTPDEIERARLTGWTPIEEFKGDKSKWRDAKEWNDYADRYLGIAKATNKKLENDLYSTKQELRQLKTTLDKLSNVYGKISEREYNRALDTIRKEQAAAIESGDSARFLELEDQKGKLEQPEKIEQPVHDKAEYDREFVEWKGENKWYGENVDMSVYAVELSEKLNAAGFYGRKLLDEVRRKVEGKFPEYFGKTSPAGKPSVLSPSDLPDKPKKKFSFDAMPEEAKAEYRKLSKQIPNYSKEQFSKDYWEDEMSEA